MTLGMNVPENEDVQLTEQNFRNVCRLCLRADEDLINVFERADQNPLKQPLTERIYDLYQIKVRMKFYFILEFFFVKKDEFSHFSWSKKMDYPQIFAIAVCIILKYFPSFVKVYTNVSTSCKIL